MIYPFCKGSISFRGKLRKGAFLHYIQFFKNQSVLITLFLEILSIFVDF